MYKWLLVSVIGVSACVTKTVEVPVVVDGGSDETVHRPGQCGCIMRSELDDTLVTITSQDWCGTKAAREGRFALSDLALCGAIHDHDPVCCDGVSDSETVDAGNGTVTER